MVDPDPVGQGLLGAHVPQRPQHIARHRQAGVALEPRQAEVGDPEIAAIVDQDVGGLDVPVEHLQLVGVLERLGRLLPQTGGGAEEGAAAGR